MFSDKRKPVRKRESSRPHRRGFLKIGDPPERESVLNNRRSGSIASRIPRRNLLGDPGSGLTGFLLGNKIRIMPDLGCIRAIPKLGKPISRRGNRRVTGALFLVIGGTCQWQCQKERCHGSDGSWFVVFRVHGPWWSARLGGPTIGITRPIYS